MNNYIELELPEFIDFMRVEDDDALIKFHSRFLTHLSITRFLSCIINLLQLDLNCFDITKITKNKITIKTSESPPKHIADIKKELMNNLVMRCLKISLISPMVNITTKRPTYYISKQSGIPLIGTHYFGVIDRGTNLIQIRPITGCPLNCIYCSVDEGPFSKTKIVDYYVEKDYLLEQIDQIVEFKGRYKIEAHIDGQGEPFLYPEIIDLIKGIKEIKGVEIISIQTNAVLLSYKTIEKLANAGLDRLNISLNSLNSNKAAYIAGLLKFNVKKILNVIKYANDLGIHVLLAPVWLNGINDDDIKEIISYAKRNLKYVKRWPLLGIQNYEFYRTGRNPKNVHMMPFKSFYEKLALLEKETGMNGLKLSLNDFSMHKRKMLPYVFKKGEIVKVKIVLPGRHKKEFIGVSKNRSIEVYNIKNKLVKIGDYVRIRIVRNKHNIYSATII